MKHPKSYGQFCPVARAAEIVATRWTPVILRELLAGSTKFNDLRQGFGLAFDSEKVTAYKYLAFIHCASNQEKLCRDDFRRAFEVDPAFKLDRTEIGHPLWGPVYNSVRAELLSKGKIRP